MASASLPPGFLFQGVLVLRTNPMDSEAATKGLGSNYLSFLLPAFRIASHATKWDLRSCSIPLMALGYCVSLILSTLPIPQLRFSVSSLSGDP